MAEQSIDLVERQIDLVGLTRNMGVTETNEIEISLSTSAAVNVDVT